jgi:Fe-S-cluster containining protein
LDQTSTAHHASTLCQQCGLCCTGLLFEYVSFEDHELGNVDVTNIKVKEPGKKTLPHPCQYLEGTSCGIYIDRPRKCQSFACTSRQRVLNGEMPLKDGSAIVTETQGLLEELIPLSKDTLGRDYRKTGFRKFAAAFAKSIDKKLRNQVMPSEVEQKTVTLCFEIIKIIDRHFRKTSRLNTYAQLVTGIAYLNEQSH